MIPVTIYDAHELSLKEIAEAMNKKISNARSNKDVQHTKSTQLFNVLPTFILGPLATIMSYLGQNAGVSIPALGVRKLLKLLNLGIRFTLILIFM